MILLLDTSTSTCYITLLHGMSDKPVNTSWDAGRDLARGLLKYINETLHRQSASWSDIQAIGVYKGPGSFTGLRIGLTVMNTLVSTYNIPIVGESGDDWRTTALDRLKNGQNDKIVMPEYGSEANITAPRK